MSKFSVKYAKIVPKNENGGILMFRPMRRARQALPMEDCEAILRRGTSGVLSVLGDDGYPYGVPLSYVWHDGALWFHCAKQGHKLDAIREDMRRRSRQIAAALRRIAEIAVGRFQLETTLGSRVERHEIAVRHDIAVHDPRIVPAAQPRADAHLVQLARVVRAPGIVVAVRKIEARRAAEPALPRLLTPKRTVNIEAERTIHRDTTGRAGRKL